MGKMSLFSPSVISIILLVQMFRVPNRHLQCNKIKAVFVDFSNLLVSPIDIGCDSHPGVSGQQKYANKLIPIVKSIMNW